MSNLSDLAAIIAEEEEALGTAAGASFKEYLKEYPCLRSHLSANPDDMECMVQWWLAAFRAGADWEQRREIEEGPCT